MNSQWAVSLGESQSMEEQVIVIKYDRYIILVNWQIEESQRRVPNCLCETREDFQEEGMSHSTVNG